MEAMLDACTSGVRSPPRRVWVDDAFLLDRGLVPFTDLPLWLPDGDGGILQIDVRKALGSGLATRPLQETVADIRGWLDARGDGSLGTAPLASGNTIRAGFDAERERAVLDAWAAR